MCWPFFFLTQDQNSGCNFIQMKQFAQACTDFCERNKSKGPFDHFSGTVKHILQCSCADGSC